MTGNYIFRGAADDRFSLLMNLGHGTINGTLTEIISSDLKLKVYVVEIVLIDSIYRKFHDKLKTQRVHLFLLMLAILRIQIITLPF